MKMQRTLSGLLATLILTFLPCVTVQSVAQGNDSAAAKPLKRRFSVVHVHLSDNCAGYLYVTEDSVRYKALVPKGYQSHSFEIQRAEITTLQPWVLRGQKKNIVEIKTAQATYHFWLLPKERDLNTAPSSNLDAIAAPAEKLIAAIRNPESGIKQSSSKAREGDTGSKSDAQGSDAGSEETDNKLPAGALEGVYVGFGIEHSHMHDNDYYFTADGWVINNIPRVNMDNFNMTAYRNNPSNKLFIGRYRVDGNQIHIVWANDANRRDLVKYNQASANPALNMYVPTCRCTGKRFSGKYHWSSPTDKRYIQFSPDGTFFDHGLTDQVVGEPNPHGYAGITDPPRNFRGTYSVHNQRLTFKFADGKQATVAFIAPKALAKAPAFKWIGLGHGSGVSDAETVIVLMLYEEHYQVQP